MRVDRAFQAFFRRMKNGETPGYPRFQGRTATTVSPIRRWGGGAVVDGGYLSPAKIGRFAMRWSRPLAGMPKTVTISKEADGWYACFSCARRRQSRCPDRHKKPV